MTILNTILVVEDDDLLSKTISYSLKRKGFKVVSFMTGEDCLDYLKTNTPDLIWLDLYLPGMGGIEFLNIIKKTKQYTNIPIIVVTCSFLDKDNDVLNRINGYYVKSEMDLEAITSDVENIVSNPSKFRVIASEIPNFPL